MLCICGNEPGLSGFNNNDVGCRSNNNDDFEDQELPIAKKLNILSLSEKCVIYAKIWTKPNGNCYIQLFKHFIELFFILDGWAFRNEKTSSNSAWLSEIHFGIRRKTKWI